MSRYCWHHPGRAATHRGLHVGFCTECAERITRRLERIRAVSLPRRVVPGSLFDEETT